MIGSETPSIWSFQRAIGENGKNSLVHSFEQPGALVSHSLKDSQKSGFSDVGDGCWRRNVLATTLRCW